MNTKHLLAVSNDGDLRGGGEYSFLSLAIHLPSLWRVTAVLPNSGSLLPPLQEHGRDLRIRPLSPLRPWLLYAVFQSFWGCLSLVRELRPNLIYANGSRAAFYWGIVGRIFRIPMMWHCRIARSDILLDWLLVRLCRIVIVNSHATAQRFRMYPKKKPKIVYNGIDLTLFSSSHHQKPGLIQNDWTVILSVARASRDKRHDIILESFEIVAQKRPCLHLVLIGSPDSADPAWWDFLQRITKQSAFSDRIHWISHQHNLAPWYYSAALFVLASENESFGRVLVEAMACGLPIVATQSGGIPEIVRHGWEGLLFPPGDVSALANAMETVLADDRLHAQLANSAKNRANSFNLQKHLDQMVEILTASLMRV